MSVTGATLIARHRGGTGGGEGGDAAGPTRLWLGALVALTSAVTYALNLVLARLAYEHGANVHAANLVRPFAFLAVVSLLIALRGRSPRVPTPMILPALGLGLVMTGVLYTLLGAIAHLAVSLTVLIAYVYPMLVALATWLSGRERPSIARAAYLVLAFLGLAFALYSAGAQVSLIGLLLAFASAVLLGSLLVLSEPVIAAAGREPVMLHMLLVAAVVVSIACATVFEPAWPRGATGWLALAVSTCMYVIATYTLLTAVELIGPLRTAVVDNSAPVWALAFAAPILGESASVRQLIGMALVIGAIVAFQVHGARRAPAANRVAD